MPRKTSSLQRRRRVPSYRLHRPSGQAVVTLGGRDYYLGPHGTEASQLEYDRLIGEWLASDRRGPVDDTGGLTIIELHAAFWQYAEGYYQRDGTPTSELGHYRYALQPMLTLYGDTAVVDFGPRCLKSLRQSWIDRGMVRTTINAYVNRVRRVFKWGVANELVPVSVYHRLQAVEGLRAYRSEAPEPKKVRPADQQHIDAVCPFVSRQIWAMIRLQLLTGMRPGEVRIMRICDLDMSGPTWLYRPHSHKNQHRGHDRDIYLGPHAQGIINEFISGDLQSYLFSPRDAAEEKRQGRRANRVTPMTPSARRRDLRRSKRKLGRHPRACYGRDSYAAAIRVACDRAGVPRWHPHQLRHNAATKLRQEYGIEAARLILGHKSLAVTEIYAEIDSARAVDIMSACG